MPVTALVAEDEPILRAALIAELAQLWPQLRVIAQAGNGNDTLTQLRQTRPTIAFLDIRMPGMTGLEVAQALAEDAEPDDAVPLIVFVTAYSEFAVAAFDQAAVDYVLKPVTAERLGRTVERLQARLAADARGDPAQASAAAHGVEQLARQIAPLLAANRLPAAAPLKFIRIGQGNSVQMLAVEQVRYFQAADKYVIVTTAQGEGLIRESLRELQPQLDPEMFVQIHRSTIVNMGWVERADRDEAGHVSLKLRGLDRLVPVSRVYAHLFRPM